MIRKSTFLIAGLYAWSCSAAAPICPPGSFVHGTVTDSSDAVIPGAEVGVKGGGLPVTITGSDGSFTLACGADKLIVKAKGFADREVSGRGKGDLKIQLYVAESKQTLDVTDDSDDATGRGPVALVLDAKTIAGMSDDPDDFSRQVQALAAAGGGMPGQATVIVDGFRTGGTIPPKSAIASIRVDPDLYSAEYERPPYQGGRVEIITKPGGPWAGTLFVAQTPSALSASNPFSSTGTPAAQRQYGLTFGGPIRRNKSDFFVALEHRSIQDYSVVNAFFQGAPLHETVSVPRELWIGNARVGWRLGDRDILTISGSATVRTARNEGIGGLVLPEAGYASDTREYAARIGNTQVLSASVLHETRFSFTRTTLNKDPVSTAPAVNFPGAFIGGGAGAGRTSDRRNSLNFSDNISWTRGAHTAKFGGEVIGSLIDDTDLGLFNGSYLFPGAGAPTSYEVVTGTPTVSLAQWQVALYAQDQWKVRPGLSLSLGLRYALQTLPGSSLNFAPRAGIAWSPDRRQKWVLRLRGGFFYSPIDTSVAEIVKRLDGTHRLDTLTYGAEPASQPVSGAIAVETFRRLAPELRQPLTYQVQATVERQLPQHWMLQANVAYANTTDALRSRNINAPILGSAADAANPLLAPRPIVSGANIFQFESTGTLRGPVYFVSLSQFSNKRFGVFLAYLASDMKTNADSPNFFGQSSYSGSGDFSRASWERAHQVMTMGQAALPMKLALSTELTVSSGAPLDVVTGRDNNGDGVFNDRPSLASQPGPAVYQTAWGMLSATGIDGNLPRNIGTLPSTVQLGTNLSRTFQLRSRGLAADRRQTLTINVRTANLLNHTNISSVGNVVGSQVFDRPIAALPARRLEGGLRFSF